MTVQLLSVRKIHALYLLDHYHIDPIKVAEWIIDQRVQIVGILDDPGKFKPKEVTKSELGDRKFQDAVQRLKREIKQLLKSRRNLRQKANRGSGCSFDLIDQIDENKQDIRGAVCYFVFDRDSFEELFLIDDIASIEDGGLSPEVDNDKPPAVLLPTSLLEQRDGQDQEVQSTDSLETAVINEADRCFDAYEQLRKNENLSYDNWMEKIKPLELKFIVPADILGVQLHYDVKNRKRSIINNLAVVTLKRFGHKYTVKEIEEIRKSHFS